MRNGRPLRWAVLAFALCVVGVAGIFPSAASAITRGTLYQQLVISWSQGDYQGHDRASFSIPGVGSGNVMCSPDTTWIQMVPADPTAENDFWAVLSQTKNGQYETAVRDARVYRYSTPTATVPHGSGNSAYLGFNTQKSIESSASGSMIGLISTREAMNQDAGQASQPTSVHLSWSWSGFGTSAAECHVSATFMTAITGRSKRIAEGHKLGLPAASSVGAVSSFGINWHGESDYPASLKWSPRAAVGSLGTLSGVCQTTPAGTEELMLTPPAGGEPYAEVTTYQGEGVTNSVTDDLFTDPESGQLGPIALPVNGFIAATVEPYYGAPASAQTQVLVSSIRKVNDPDADADYCEVAVQAVSAPNPLF